MERQPRQLSYCHWMWCRLTGSHGDSLQDAFARVDQLCVSVTTLSLVHIDVLTLKWWHYCSFEMGIHKLPMDSPHKVILVQTLGLAIPPTSTKLNGGIYWFHLVRLSVCGQNRVHSVSSTILVRSISYLQILSSNFRRCVMCKVCSKIWNFGKFFKFVALTLSSFDLGSIMTQWVLMRGVSPERRLSSCSSFLAEQAFQLSSC